MKRKLLFTLVLAVLTVMLLAISVSAGEIVLSSSDIQSMSSTGAGTDWGDPNQLFDGNKNSESGWLVGNGWAGTKNTELTIVLKEEVSITSFLAYVWTNWKAGYSVKFYDAKGTETYSVDFNGFNSMDGVPRELIDEETTSVKAQKIVFKRYDYGNDGYLRNFSVVELEIYAEHSCTYTIPGNVLYPPTCAMDGEQEWYCRCGEMTTDLIMATGEHNVGERVVFRDGYNNPGMLAKACATCATLDEFIEEVPALFTSIGYSVSEFGKNGVTQGVFVNLEAIAKYNEYAAVPLEYGMVAGARSALSSGNPLVMSGDTVSKASNVVAFKNFTSTTSTLISYSLNGFSDTHKDTQLIVSAYIYDGDSIYYLSGESISTDVETVSYNDVLDISAPSVVEAIIKEN